MAQKTPARPANDPKLATVQAAQELDDEELEDEVSAHKFLFFNVMPSWMVSFVTHVVLIILLAIWLMPVPKERTVSLEASEQASEEIEQIDINLT